MVKLAKVFIIISMILFFYLIFPIVLGIISIRKLDSVKTVDELLPWGVTTLICVSPIAGILMLCIKQDDIDKARFYHNNITSTGYLSSNDKVSNLIELKQLFDDGIIDEQTYNEKRTKLVKEL